MAVQQVADGVHPAVLVAPFDPVDGRGVQHHRQPRLRDLPPRRVQAGVGEVEAAHLGVDLHDRAASSDRVVGRLGDPGFGEDGEGGDHAIVAVRQVEGVSVEPVDHPRLVGVRQCGVRHHAHVGQRLQARFGVVAVRDRPRWVVEPVEERPHRVLEAVRHGVHVQVHDAVEAQVGQERRDVRVTGRELVGLAHRTSD